MTRRLSLLLASLSVACLGVGVWACGVGRTLADRINGRENT